MGFRPFIYGLYDPEDPGHIRYVGMAFKSMSRPHDHGIYAHKPSVKKSHLVNWIRKLQAENRKYSILVLEELPSTATRARLGFIERCYITSLRQIGHQLTNVAAGGEGG